MNSVQVQLYINNAVAMRIPVHINDLRHLINHYILWENRDLEWLYEFEVNLCFGSVLFIHELGTHSKTNE